MTIKLGEFTTSTAASGNNELVLSPGIFDQLKSKVIRTRDFPASNSLAAKDNLQVLVAYISGWPINNTLLRPAVRSLVFPIRILALEVIIPGISNQAKQVAAARELYSLAQEVQISNKLIYMGGYRLCALLDADTKPEDTYLNLKKIAKQLDCEITMGIGGIMTEYKQLQSGYRAAVQILRLGQDFFSKPYRYSTGDLGILAMLVEGSEHQSNARVYGQQIITSLAKPKNLLPTLRQLFVSAMSPSEAARALRVHRNTVIYRLNKIRTQTGLDVLDFNDALQLRLALAVHDMRSAPVVVADSTASTHKELSTLSDYFMTTAFACKTMSDSRLIEWAQSMDIDLTGNFFCFLLRGVQDFKLDNKVKNTTIINMANVGEGQTLLITKSSQTDAKRLATQLSTFGKVAWVSSEEVQGKLSSTLLTLQNYLEISGSTHAGENIVTQKSVGCYGVFGSDIALQDSCQFASKLSARLGASPQLSATVTTLLDCSLNLTLAARRLKVHRNTLIYRIGRIKYLLGYDLTIFEEAVQVRLALLLSRLT